MKNIEIYDDIVPFTERSAFYMFAQNSRYTIGWEDRDEYEKKAFPCLHSSCTPDDLTKMNILPFIENILKQSKFKKNFHFKSITKALINLSKPGDIHYNHVHAGNIGILYYINLDWKPEWCGETLFWDKDEKEIIYTSPYKPGRFIIFDAQNIPHTLRPQSYVGPAYRFTLSIFFRREQK